MYVPDVFTEDDPVELGRLMDAYSFALLVTTDADGLPFATHLPFLYDAAHGERGTLLGHMARANPQWQHFAEGRDALVVFQGPHAYVSPSWYVGQPNVPTWNYAAVHAYGAPRVLDDPTDAKTVLQRLVDVNEAHFVKPWRMQLPAQYETAMIRAIVAFEIPVTRLEGKFKMSQNRKAEDAVGARQGLEARGDADALAVARLMQARAPAG